MTNPLVITGETIVPNDEQDSTNVLQILARMQQELNELQESNQTLTHENTRLIGQLNGYRLMMFPRADGSDYLTNCSKVQISIVDLIAADPSLDALGQFHKMHLYYTSLAGEMIDKHKSSTVVKIARQEKHDKAMKEVEKIRKEPKTKSAKIKLNQLDRTLQGMRKTFFMLNDKQFIAMVKVTPAYAEIPEEDIQASIDKSSGKK